MFNVDGSAGTPVPAFIKLRMAFHSCGKRKMVLIKLYEFFEEEDYEISHIPPVFQSLHILSGPSEAGRDGEIKM